MTQVIITSNKATVRRVLPGLVTAAAVMVVQMWTATPAHANHSVTIRHAPPPVAKAGSDVRLAVAVDGCWMFCSPISVQVNYRTADGRTRTIHRSLGSFGPQTAVVVIPGRHVVKPALLYFLEAAQGYCWYDVCHDADARLPETGSYRVVVQ